MMDKQMDCSGNMVDPMVGLLVESATDFRQSLQVTGGPQTPLLDHSSNSNIQPTPIQHTKEIILMIPPMCTVQKYPKFHPLCLSGW